MFIENRPAFDIMPIDGGVFSSTPLKRAGDFSRIYLCCMPSFSGFMTFP